VINVNFVEVTFVSTNSQNQIELHLQSVMNSKSFEFMNVEVITIGQMIVVQYVEHRR